MSKQRARFDSLHRPKFKKTFIPDKNTNTYKTN